MERKSNHNQLSDIEFLEQFANGSLDSEIFNHEAHLRLAWLLIGKFGLHQAEKAFQYQLQNYVEIVGAKDKYHKTLTIVAIRIVNQFMQKSNSTIFLDFINEFPELKSEFKELVNNHYSFSIFDSEKAKTEFLKPDLLTFNKD